MNIETSPAPASAPSVEHLQRIIEKQPACLMRVGIDGVLLAANDAALGLFEARQAHQVLERALTEWIVPEHHELWRKFASAVADGSRSLQCDLTDMSGRRRTILFHGIPLLDHADGIPSIILGARDISMVRQLEAAQEAEKAQNRPFPERGHLERLLLTGRKHLEDQRAQLAAAAAEQQRLEALLEARETAYQRLVTEQAAAGRLALEVGGDLQRLAEAIDARAVLLLAQCSPDSQYRDELEALRGDALRVGLLACQIAQARSQTPTTTNQPHAGRWVGET